MDDDAELIESGPFRVDRARALEKLQEFQFSDPALFILAFVRCAVESGALKIGVESHPAGFQFTFDGGPVPEARLKAPFEALFAEEGDRSQRDRHLALGLLGALRTIPAALTVESGAGDARRRLRLDSFDQFTVENVSETDAITRITVRWTPKWMGDAPRILPALREACAMLPIPLTIDNVPIPQLPAGEEVPVHSFTAGSVRGHLVAAPMKSGLFSFLGEKYPSRLYLYKEGVRIDTVEHNFPIAAEAHLESPGFAANATYSGVLIDPAYEAAVATARSHCDELVRKAALEQRERAENDTRGYLSIHGLGAKRVPAWMRLLGRAPLLGEKRLKKISGISLEARVAAWLRYTASVILEDPEHDRKSAARWALWKCPLYVSATGRPLSLLQLHRQFKRIGYVPFTDPGPLYPDAWAFRFEPFLHVVWKLDSDDVCLKRLFNNKLRTWGAVSAAWDIARLPFRRLLKDKGFYDERAETATAAEPEPRS